LFKYRKNHLAKDKQINSAINTPVNNIVKETFIIGVHIDIVKKLVKKKLVKASSSREEMLKMLHDQKECLNRLSNRKTRSILIANKKIDKLMFKLKNKIQELVNKISIQLQNIISWNDKYLNPLSNQIEIGIKCVRDEMRKDFRIILNDKEVNKTFHEVAKAIRFDFENHIHDCNKQIDFLKLRKINRRNR
jgi:hypothetical protein